MNVSEANDVNTPLLWLLRKRIQGVRPLRVIYRPDDAEAIEAAGRLAGRANRALSAGLQADDVRDAWPVPEPAPEPQPDRPALLPAEWSALTSVRVPHGRRWRGQLRQWWESGKYPASLESCVVELQSVRDKVGPSGLDRIRTEDLW